jgi:hypothetical protein
MSQQLEARKARRGADRIRERLSYANVIATVALFIALGGSAWALSRGEVKSRHIANNAVTTPKIKNNAVTAPKLACKGNSAADKMVRAGSVCIDRYEASIWTAKTGGSQITGAIPCDANGQDCKGKIFARSVKGVAPRDSITYFQAQQALANSGKRLPSNTEWQQAVAGTPDSSACNVSTGSVANAGANPACVSSHGANDMVGNLWEWVADWVPRSSTCGSWPAGYGGDSQCLAGAATTGAPGALIRGGFFGGGTNAGPFAVNGPNEPSGSFGTVGFRGAR